MSKMKEAPLCRGSKSFPMFCLVSQGHWFFKNFNFNFIFFNNGISYLQRFDSLFCHKRFLMLFLSWVQFPSIGSMTLSSAQPMYLKIFYRHILCAPRPTTSQSFCFSCARSARNPRITLTFGRTNLVPSPPSPTTYAHSRRRLVESASNLHRVRINSLVDIPLRSGTSVHTRGTPQLEAGASNIKLQPDSISATRTIHRTARIRLAIAWGWRYRRWANSLTLCSYNLAFRLDLVFRVKAYSLSGLSFSPRSSIWRRKWRFRGVRISPPLSWCLPSSRPRLQRSTSRKNSTVRIRSLEISDIDLAACFIDL